MPYFQPGDQIMIGIKESGDLVKHHGIYVGDYHWKDDKIWPNEGVVHFQKEKFLGEVKIRHTDIYSFCKDPTRIKDIKIITRPPSKYSRERIIFEALKKVEEYEGYGGNFISQLFGSGYKITNFNCEHLATYCRTGKATSEQVDKVIQFIGTYGPPLREAYLRNR